jgi:hypothetical protein
MATLQALQAVYSANANLTTALPIDNTVPASGEGTEVLSQAIALASSANKVLVEVTLWGRAGSEAGWGAALFRGSTCIQAQAQLPDFDDLGTLIAFDLLDAPGSVGPHSYSVRVGAQGGAALRLNGIESGRRFGGVSKCTLTLREIG